MKSILLFIFCCMYAFAASAQQKPQYSQYMINNYLINPAISGIEEYADVKLGSRQQWAGIDGAPFTMYASVHAPIGYSSGGKRSRSATAPSFGRQNQRPATRVKPHHGIGLMVMRDKVGSFSRTEVSFSYAYHLLLNDEIKLAAGTSLGIIQQSLQANELKLADPSDNAAVSWSATKPNLSVGLWLYSSTFYVGLSGSQLFANDVHFDNNIEERNYLYKHFFLTAAYKFDVTDRFSVIPSVMATWSQPLPGALDYNLRVIYENRVWVGGSYRQNDSFAVLAGVTLNHIFDVSYAYDTGISDLGGMSSGSHEVVLGMRLFNKRKVLCPSNLW
ncbi:PorP/SprF family type IX secretion system membrane protein [Pontibacter chitinilyticus]|uniref:PorP/SprF family type IX secretion system membrane protein n=1 Tax=Pontibacter chitinilyticus TaxID=2674989 RepID=UPI00321BA241